MRNLFALVFIVLLLTSCNKEYIQIFDTASTNTKLQNGSWVFETDSVRLTYSFWANKGLLSLTVFNKLDKPLYIDWKNCSFIYNGDKLNYWRDEQLSTSTSTSSSRFYSYRFFVPITVGSSVSESSIKSVKPERITFIPPKSNFSISQFILLPYDYFRITEKTATKTQDPRSDNPAKMTTVYEEKFDYNSTPLRFRNFLSFSFAENSTSFFYTDNEFYLTNVREMDYRHYKGKKTMESDGTLAPGNPLNLTATSFYIKLEPQNNMRPRTIEEERNGLKNVNCFPKK